MGYLANKQKNRKEGDYENLPIKSVKEIEGTPFQINRVIIKDLPGNFGVRHTAICDLTLSTGEKVTCFIDKTAPVRDLEEGIADGYDWTSDGIFYLIEKVMKKKGDGSYWLLREA